MILFNRHNLTMRSARNTVLWTFDDTETGQFVAEVFERTSTAVVYLRMPAAGPIEDPASFADVRLERTDDSARRETS